MSFARDSELNGVVWLMFAFCINKFMKNVRTHVCGTAKGRCCFPMKRKWKSAKSLEHGSAYLTQLQYIINLLCEKRTKDNVADSRQRRKKTSVIWYYVTRLIGSNSKSAVWNKNWEKTPNFYKSISPQRRQKQNIFTDFSLYRPRGRDRSFTHQPFHFYVLLHRN